MVLVLSASKPISKPIIVSAPKPAATAPVSKPVPVKSGKPAIKGGFVFKDPFMVRQFKLAGLIINQVTEVAAGKVTSIVTQETLRDEDTSNEDDNDKDRNDNEGSKGNDDDSDDENNAAMDVDSIGFLFSKVFVV
ncbi:hypothetical protein C0995_014337 [Termitomyces sp. Mi166|nr:hypothetical protein C0995_014337 [Termitomyces sp. Mi166\